MILDVEPRVSVNPLWWRIPTWAALTVVSVIQAPGFGDRVVTGVLMGAGAVVLQLVPHHDQRVRAPALLFSTAAGLAACFFTPQGLAELLVVVCAGRSARIFEGVALRWYTGIVTIAFGLTVGYITDSLPGLLAGLGIPLLVQRSLERQVVVRERDRAQALLAEVQAGREAETQAAALRERGRIARELHDVLAHTLAGLSVQLQAVRAVAAREQVGPTLLEPIDRAAALARDGLSEARSVVGALREPVGLGVDDLPALVERHPGHATLAVVGPPGAITPDAGHAVYRAVQESLTNCARYAPGSPAGVTLTWAASSLVVEVVDDGPAPGRAVIADQGTGLGLAGMTERIGSVGGRLSAGPRPDRGWAVRVEVPTT